MIAGSNATRATDVGTPKFRAQKSHVRSFLVKGRFRVTITTEICIKLILNREEP